MQYLPQNSRNVIQKCIERVITTSKWNLFQICNACCHKNPELTNNLTVLQMYEKINEENKAKGGDVSTSEISLICKTEAKETVHSVVL